MRSQVRLAEPGDWESLARLRFQWRTEEGDERGELEGFSHSFRLWLEDHAESHQAFLAEVLGEPVGMAWVARVERVPGPTRWDRVAGMIQSVYVRPLHRGGGVGAALLSLAVAWSKEQGMEYLMVHPSERSRTLYQRIGFEMTDRHMELALRQPRSSPEADGPSEGPSGTGLAGGG